MESYRPDQPHAATHLKMPAQVVRVADTEVEVAAVQHRYHKQRRLPVICIDVKSDQQPSSHTRVFHVALRSAAVRCWDRQCSKQ